MGKKTVVLFILIIPIFLSCWETLSANGSLSEPYIVSASSGDLPTQLDFEEGVAAVKRAMRINNIQSNIPKNLVNLNEAFNTLSQKIHANDKPDNVDMVLLVDTNGKTQAASATRFLANLENELIGYVKSKNPDIDLKLACLFDSFVAAGSGAVPAATGALGEITQESVLNHIWDMPSKMIYPKSANFFLKCCGCAGNTAESIVSAYFSQPILVERESSDWDSLIYDAFDFKKSGCKNLIDIFSSNTTHDLKSSLEIITLHDSESIIELVFGAILARDNDAKSSVKRVAIAELLSGAQGLLHTTTFLGNKTLQAQSENLASKLGGISLLLKQSVRKYGNLSELKNALLKRQDLPRDMIILNISADTFPGKIMVPSFSYDIKQTDNEKTILNLNYRFAIPSHLYQPKKGDIELFKTIVENGVDSVFPFENSRRTNISTATKMLINFLNECSDKIIRAIEKVRAETP